jgi:hypothetical protein
MGTKYIENKWTIYDDYAELYIDNPTHGKFYLKIDLEDYERCSKYHWNIQHAGGKYSYKYYGYARIDGKQTLLHRYIMNVTDRKQTVDHINKDGIVDETDNRKYNLRSARGNCGVMLVFAILPKYESLFTVTWSISSCFFETGSLAQITVISWPNLTNSFDK